MVSKRLHRPLILMLLLASAALCACQPKVLGLAYIDDNANLAMDSNESRLGYAKYVVTLDSETVAEGVTDSDGSFIVKATKPGYYCAEVTSGNSLSTTAKSVVATSETGATEKSAVKSSMAKAVTEEDSTTDTDSDGKPDSTDDDIDGDGYLNGNDNCRKIANSTQLDTDNDGFGDACDLCPETENDDTDDDGKADECGSSGTVEEKEPTVETGKACVNVKGRSVEVNVPVARDYSATINTLPAEDTVSMFSGEPVTVKFNYPSACSKFDTITLDPLLQSKQVWITTAQANTSVLNLSAVVSTPNTIGIPTASIAADSLATASFPLIADPSFIGEKTVTIRIKARCPDESTVYTLEKKIKVTGKYPVETTCSLPETPSATATKIVLKCDVQNISSVDLGDVELRAGVKDYYSLTGISLTYGMGNAYKCNKYGSYGMCVFALDAKEKFTFEFTFDISSREGEFVSYANTTIADRPDLEPVDAKDSATWNPPATAQ